MMKKVLLCCALAATLAFAGCERVEEKNPAEGNDSGKTTAEITVSTPKETEAPETDAPETEAPETKAPETEAPKTEADTQAPAETNAPEETEANTDSSVDTKAADDFMNTLNGKKMYIELYAEQGGMSVSAVSAMDITGGKNNTYMSVNVSGFEMCVLTNENGAYIIDNASKCYYAGDNKGNDDFKMLTTTNYKKTGSGTGTLNGEKCSYCQYDIVNTDGETDVYKVYFKNGKVVAIETADDAGVVMTVKKYSSEPPAGIFKIPAGYTEKNIEDAFNFSY